MTRSHAPTDPPPAPSGKRLAALTLGALGVVYGDIGTSPLYALRECFQGASGATVTHDNVLGVLSLIFWSLIFLISIKYLAYVLRADNRGEGGILALMALATSKLGGKSGYVRIMLGLFGAALLYGDGMITPAISVLGAVEGLGVAAPSLSRFVQPITIGLLFALFFLQKRGTAKIGQLFGPIMLLWFLTLAVLGGAQVLERPEVILALDPRHGFAFLTDHGSRGFLVLGGVLLVVTGGEALYADMGHFGRRPIRIAWFSLALPALVLNYLGQGALLLQEPDAAVSPFFRLAPDWALYPLIVLSICAAVIASQALISGVFSLTRQAAMLGFWPRVRIQHTSAREIGQIYVPSINWLLLCATVGLVLEFKSSSNLATAYGIAVTMTMVITTLLAFFVARELWGRSLPVALGVTAAFLVADLSFLGANLVKVSEGGWFPLGVGAGIFLLMTTWKRGRALLAQRIFEQIIPLEDFFEVMRVELPARVPGAAVFMTSNPQGAPPALLQNFRLNRVVHERVILLTLITEEVARVPARERVQTETLSHGFTRVIARYGFMETPDIIALLERSDTPNLSIEHTTFFLGRETLLAHGRLPMARWRERLFVFMSRNALGASAFFNVPPDRVMEVGAQVEL